MESLTTDQFMAKYGRQPRTMMKEGTEVDPLEEAQRERIQSSINQTRVERAGRMATEEKVERIQTETGLHQAQSESIRAENEETGLRLETGALAEAAVNAMPDDKFYIDTKTALIGQGYTDTIADSMARRMVAARHQVPAVEHDKFGKLTDIMVEFMGVKLAESLNPQPKTELPKSSMLEQLEGDFLTFMRSRMPWAQPGVGVGQDPTGVPVQPKSRREHLEEMRDDFNAMASAFGIDLTANAGQASTAQAPMIGFSPDGTPASLPHDLVIPYLHEVLLDRRERSRIDKEAETATKRTDVIQSLGGDITSAFKNIGKHLAEAESEATEVKPDTVSLECRNCGQKSVPVLGRQVGDKVFCSLCGNEHVLKEAK